MPIDLKADKDASAKRWNIAKAIDKKLAPLSDEDRLIVLRHVAAEYKLDLIPLGPAATVQPKGDAK